METDPDSVPTQTQALSAGNVPHPAPVAQAQKSRFLPGTILARRYRIVNLLGRGGMGEVYRADDLILGQTVALKFLPETASNQIESRERLFNEVRAAREITHPSVCRVHDIGEMDGQLYISMEFVDGEDLASLLSRIGRLPAAKASELAAGICAGLAAAHRKGLIHRDLKPANIMVDGRGQPRVMDFGLAASAGQVAASEVRLGTPAYMAPEQLAGKEVTFRSDLYALGLILYELYTGRRPFEGRSFEALLAARERNAPAPVSTLCPEVNPSIESAIAACLSPDPARRPPSAQAVAAMLPYQDALAAVLAAGDTPSPELIAASGPAKRVRPAVAYGMAAVIAAALLGGYLLKAPFGVAPEQPPEVLAHSARMLAAQFGYPARPAGTSYGFVAAGSGKELEIRFWYRESASGLQAIRFGNFLQPPGRVTWSDPPLEPGMLAIETDTRGRLVHFVAAPQAAPAPNLPDWSALFGAAGLDLSRFTEAPVRQLPPVAADRLFRWMSRAASDAPGREVAAASWMGQPVYFQVLDARAGPPEDRWAFAPAAAVVLFAAVLAVSLLAGKYLRQRRGDRKGAFRVAAAMFSICSAEWLLVARHSFRVQEAFLAADGLSWALATSALAFLVYLALDPTVRRIYPDMLVSLQRVLTGARRDALLGWDILCGLLIAALANLFVSLTAFNAAGKTYDTSALTLRGLAGLWMADLRLGAWIGLLALACSTPLMGLRRRRRMRFGALGVIIAETGIFCLKDMPAVPDASAWYAQAPLVGYAALVLLTVYAARLAAGPGRASGVTQA